MSRKQFIESNGATCRNWTWSWSFVNEEERFIIFGAWDLHDQINKSLIFGLDWEFNGENKKNVAYKQSLEHIRLIEEEGYGLKVFKIYYSGEKKDEMGHGPSTIKRFDKELEDRILSKEGNQYYALKIREHEKEIGEIDDYEEYIEGTAKKIKVNTYERDHRARTKCINHFGSVCQVCDVNLERVYGEIAKDFIHVHHIKPLSEIKNEYKVDPVKDLVPLCPNCHAIIHRTKPALKVEELRRKMKQVRAMRLECCK